MNSSMSTEDRKEPEGGTPRTIRISIVDVLLDRTTVLIGLILAAIMVILIWHRTQLENRLSSSRITSSPVS